MSLDQLPMELVWGVLEWVGLVFGIAQVLLARNNNVLLYPAGIVATSVSIFVMANAQLYAESALQLYYLIMSIYGWAHWLRGADRPELPITKAGRRDWAIVAAITGLGWLLLYWALRQFTNSDVPAIDAWVTATAWAGMWLLARRKLENWLVLNVSNLFAIPLLFYKGLPLYGILTLVLFVVAISGYFKWRRIMNEETPQKA